MATVITLDFELPSPNSLTLIQLATTRVAVALWSQRNIVAKIRQIDFRENRKCDRRTVPVEIRRDLTAGLEGLKLPDPLPDDVEDVLSLVGEELFEFFEIQ